MFNQNRYLTKGVQTEIPLELQIFMWECIENLPEPKDYFSRGRVYIGNERPQATYGIKFIES